MFYFGRGCNPRILQMHTYVTTLIGINRLLAYVFECLKLSWFIKNNFRYNLLNYLRLKIKETEFIVLNMDV